MVVDLETMLARNYFSLKRTMRIIDNGGLGIAFVVDDSECLIGVVTDGDIRRAILNGAGLDEQIKRFANARPIVAQTGWTKDQLSSFLQENEGVRRRIPEDGSLKVPVVDSEGRIKRIVFVSRDRVVYQAEDLHEGQRKIRNILVVGGGGYLGSVLSDRLLAKGYRVSVLDDLSCGREGISSLEARKNFTFTRGDMRDISVLVSSIKRADAVILLAGIEGDEASALDPARTLEINYLATKMVIDCCKYFQINRVIFASTCSVYGPSKTEDLLNEGSSLSPTSLFAETKAKCEQSILESVDENFSPVILRMGALFGYSPNMRYDLSVNLMAAQAILEREVKVPRINQSRPFLHLSDAVDAYLLCLEAPMGKVKGEIFNVVSQNLSIIEIGRILGSMLSDLRIEIEGSHEEMGNLGVSYSRIKDILGFEPKFKVQDGIAEIKRRVDMDPKLEYKDPKYRRSASFINTG